MEMQHDKGFVENQESFNADFFQLLFSLSACCNCVLQ